MRLFRIKFTFLFRPFLQLFCHLITRKHKFVPQFAFHKLYSWAKILRSLDPLYMAPCMQLSISTSVCPFPFSFHSYQRFPLFLDGKTFDWIALEILLFQGKNCLLHAPGSVRSKVKKDFAPKAFDAVFLVQNFSLIVVLCTMKKTHSSHQIVCVSRIVFTPLASGFSRCTRRNRLRLRTSERRSSPAGKCTWKYKFQVTMWPFSLHPD